MELKNCVACGKVFVHGNSSSEVCATCLAGEQELAERVVSYLRKFDGVILLEEICACLDVKPSVIKRLQERGWLIGEADIHYACQTCGQPILAGRLCKQCMQGLKNDLDQMLERDQAQPKLTSARQVSRGRTAR